MKVINENEKDVINKIKNSIDYHRDNLIYCYNDLKSIYKNDKKFCSLCDENINILKKEIGIDIN